MREIVASCLPGIHAMDAEDRIDLLDAYVDNIVQREFAELGYPVRRPQTLRAWLRQRRQAPALAPREAR